MRYAYIRVSTEKQKIDRRIGSCVDKAWAL